MLVIREELLLSLSWIISSFSFVTSPELTVEGETCRALRQWPLRSSPTAAALPQRAGNVKNSVTNEEVMLRKTIYLTDSSICKLKETRFTI